MKTTLLIVLLPVAKFDRKWHAEHYENCTFNSIDEFESTLYSDISHAPGYEIYNLSDFMDLCNDEYFFPDNYWLSYVYLENVPNYCS